MKKKSTQRYPFRKNAVCLEKKIPRLDNGEVVVCKITTKSAAIPLNGVRDLINCFSM